MSREQLDKVLAGLVTEKINGRMQHIIGSLDPQALAEIINEETTFAYRVAKAVLDDVMDAIPTK